MYGSVSRPELGDGGMPDWKRELLRKKRTMQKAFPSWAALVAPGSDERPPPRRKAVHLAPRVPDELVCQLPRGGPRASIMGEDKRGSGLIDGSYSDHSSAQGDLSSEGEPDDEWQYGPGFVDRLRCKFLSLSLRETQGRPAGRQRPLRAYASVENLLEPRGYGGSYGATATGYGATRLRSPPAQTQPPVARSSFPRARSMETLLDPLVNEDVVIIERNPRPAAGINDVELPRADIVRTCKRIFEASTDNRRPVRRRPPVLRARGPLRSDKENNQPSARTLSAAPVRLRPVANIKPLCKQDDTPGHNEKPADVSLKPLKPVGNGCLVSESHVDDRTQDSSEDRVTDGVEDGIQDRVQDRIQDRTQDRVQDHTQDRVQERTQDRTQDRIVQDRLDEGRNALASETKAAELLRPSALLRTTGLWPPKTPGGGVSSLGTNSVVFDFRGKKVKPHVAVSPAPTTAGDSDELDSCSDEPLPFPSGIVFVGENVRVGRGALLTTRNKKLKIQFDDAAVVTFEYPADDPGSRVTSPGQVPEANGLHKGGSLGTYTPSAVSSSESFQLGLWRPTRPATEEEAPVAPEEPREPSPPPSWSNSTVSSDLLF